MRAADINMKASDYAVPTQHKLWPVGDPLHQRVGEDEGQRRCPQSDAVLRELYLPLATICHFCNIQ